MASNELRRAVSESVFVRQDGKTRKVTAYILGKVRRRGVPACRIFVHRLEDDMIVSVRGTASGEAIASGGEVEACWYQEDSIAGTGAGRKRIS
jgi:hypothetical protein